jgi:hypothetical protein
METRLEVDKNKGLIETEVPLALKLLAKLISYIFHPVFVPLYVILFLVFIHPYLFAGFNPGLMTFKVIGSAFVCFTFFPIITVLLLKGLNFIDSIFLKTQRDRIIPLIACMIWYFWVWYIWKNFGKVESIDMPIESVRFAFACFISTIIALMANIKMKISLHAISVGLMLTFICLLAYSQDVNFGLYLVAAFIITGMVCTSRLLISNHTNAEVYIGLLAGAVSMCIGWWWM